MVSDGKGTTFLLNDKNFQDYFLIMSISVDSLECAGQCYQLIHECMRHTLVSFIVRV